MILFGGRDEDGNNRCEISIDMEPERCGRGDVERMRTEASWRNRNGDGLCVTLRLG